MATAAQKKAAAKRKAEANLKASYGFAAMLAKKVPEIGNLMKKAVAQKWTSQRFQMEVAGTRWWKGTAAQTRQWITQQVSDPASANRNKIVGGRKISTIAGAMGLGSAMTGAIAQDIWLDTQLAGYDEQQIRAEIYNRLTGKVSIDQAGGEFGNLINQAKEMAANYGYAPGDLAAQVKAAAGVGLSFGDESQQGLSGWETKLKNYAKAKYAAFADRIDQGETVKDIAQPFVDRYAEILEVNPMDVGLNDKLMQKWLQGTPAQGGQPPAAIPVWQAEEDLRKDPRWGYTNNAMQQTADVATTIGKAFGMIGN